MKDNFEIKGKTKYILGVQHVLAMFGATVLVPITTGLNTSIALICAGIGTLIFHLCTQRKVPVFLGSSFAFIGALQMVLKEEGIAYVKGGVIVAGFIYFIMSYLVRVYGADKVKSFFPPVVTGPIIMVIGLKLSPVALSMCGYENNRFKDSKSLIVAIIVIATMIIVSSMKKSFFRLVPILISVFVGYMAAFAFGIVDLTAFREAKIIGLSPEAWSQVTTLPKFSLTAILAIAPIALVTFIEHLGDIITNGAVVGKDFMKDPGIDKTLLGDGLATIAAGFIGGPANTTYGENTGVLAVTKVYDPKVLRIAAVYAIILGFLGKFGALLQNMPTPIMGGVSVILFGMIAAVGVRTVVDARLDFANSRNLLIAALIFVLGIAVDQINIWKTVSLSGLALAAIVGIFLNKILPQDK